MLFSKKRDFAFFVLPILLVLSVSTPVFAQSSNTGAATSIVITKASTATDAELKTLKEEVSQLKQKQAEQEKKITWLEAQVNALLKSLKLATGSTGSSSSSSVAPADDSALLFSDDFSGAFPGMNWAYVPKDANGIKFAPSIDQTSGNPAPSMSIPGIQLLQKPTYSDGGVRVGSGIGVEVKTAVNPFNSASGVRFSADITDNGSTTIDFRIDNQNDRNVYAEATIFENYVTYVIRTSSTSGTRVNTPTMPDNDFHTFSFVVDANGNAKWLRDDVTQTSASGFPTGDYTLSFKSTSGTSYSKGTADVKIDNVKVTTWSKLFGGKSTTSGQSTTGGTTAKTTGPGKLSVSDDSGGYLYIGSSYIGRGAAVVSLNPGTYTLYATSASTGDVCWQKSVVISSGKTTTAKISGKYCR